ncbi:MAG: phage holin family protein [Pseudomonadota bacterium]|nr:phage holin family protein [Pseudomonadota bacterium]
MSDPVLKLQLLARSELALAHIRARRATERSTLFIVAMVFALLGLGMLNFAAYHALTPSFGPAKAAFLVSLVNIVIAMIVILVARRAGPSENEEKMAREMRDLVYNELNGDVEEVKAKLGQITADVNRIRSGFTSFSSGASSIAPLIGMLVKTLKKDR